jgi:hypothetical protein
MPFKIVKYLNGKYSVQNRITGHLFSHGSTLKAAKAQLRLLEAKMSGAGQGRELEYKSMSDADLNAYFPGARVVKYSEIPKNKSVMDWIRPNEVVFLLYEQEINQGHWCGICRSDDAVYYFDSYGNPPEKPLSWNSPEKNEELQQEPGILKNMLYASPLPVYFNDYDYQSKENGVSTCGRHVSMFFCFFKKLGGDLRGFKKMIDAERKKQKKTADELATEVVTI